MNTLSKPAFGFLRVAAASPIVHLGNIKETTTGIILMAVNTAQINKARLIVFPELCLAGGYTSADLFHQNALLEASQRALGRIIDASKTLETIIVVGLPLIIHSGLYNVAAVVSRGQLLGIVPKTYLPTGGEFYESRWFNSAHDLTVNSISLFGEEVPVGTDLLFVDPNDQSVILGVELCEDLWTPIPPSSYAALAGATVIANLSASNELVGKASYRRSLVEQQSGRAICGYVYSSAGVGESTTDVVFGGHRIIAENGAVIKEESLLLEEKGMRGGPKADYTLADLDISSCVHDRMRTTSFGKSAHELQNRRPYRRITTQLPLETGPQAYDLNRPNPARPFVPNKVNENKICSDIFRIQSAGLTQRMIACGAQHVVLGLSGGLDSTLALLVCLEAFADLGLDRKKIHAYSMPGPGTTSRTRKNSRALARLTGVSFKEIRITPGAGQILRDIEHAGDEDITYENAQARYRTLILMQKANQLGGIVIGTGDLSESAIGWCTYNGDHMSHYNVNCSIPKTLVRYIIDWATANNQYGPNWSRVVRSILDTPVSPELISATDDEVSQKTEDIVGPYDLHDFFLYHFIRKGAPPSKILYLATLAFAKKAGSLSDDPPAYEKDTIKKWLIVFLKRFFANQFKRSAVPDGPKVGSVSLSPRGDWRMPSDASAATWIAELEKNS